MTRTDGSTEYDIFISYHRADKEKVMPIYRALRDEGLKVWIDETDVSDYTSITGSIVDGLSRSKALLAYYSHTYPQRRACQWELTAAILASGQEADPTRRILVINPETGVEHIHPVELRDAKFRKMPKDAGSDAISKIAASVKAHVSDLTGLIGDIRVFKPLNWYGARKGFGSNRFVGRLPYMWKIHSALTASGFPLTAGAKTASSVAQVHGMGGVGKSLLALEYALRYGAALQASLSSTPFTDFINKLVNPTKDALEFASELTGTLPTGHETSIASTFLRSIEKMGPDGQDFLRLASRLAVAPIPASLAISVFCEADGLTYASGEDRATLAIHSAEKLSLAKRVEGGDVAFLVHTLVSRTMRFRDREPKRSGEFRDAAVRVLTDEFRENANDPRTHHELDLVVVHARELVSRDEEIAMVDLMGWVAQYDHVRGVYKSAENLYHVQWEIRRRILGDEHPDTLTSMNNLAVTLSDQGDLTGAREKQEEVLEITSRILGDEHPDTSVSAWNLFSTLFEMDDPKAKAVFENDLLWLLDRDPATLGANQQQIRGMIIQLIRDKTEAEI